jgi:hypothetical protein
MPLTSINSALDVVDTTDQCGIGAEFIEYHATYGERLWIYVKNDGGSSVTAGMGVVRKASTLSRGTGAKGATSSIPMDYLGVAQHTIADGSFGWVLKRGQGTVLADTGGISANQGLVAGNAVAGAFDSTSTATTACVGRAHAAIAAAATGVAWINCPG